MLLAPAMKMKFHGWEGYSETDQNLLAESIQEGGRGRVAIAVVESDEILLFEIAQHGMRQVGDTFRFEWWKT